MRSTVKAVHRIAKSSAAGVALFIWAGAASCADEPLKLKMSGSLEAGLMQHRLNAGYGKWHGQFVRGVLQSDSRNVWNAEIVNVSEFGDSGVLLTAGLTHTLNDDWYVAASAASSSGGFFLPRARLDLAVSRKWLGERNLVSTLGFTAVNAKDGHSDRSLLFALAYYFDRPWVLEGGLRLNRSNPGSVDSNSGFIAATYGEDKRRLLSLRYGTGTEAYQLIGVDAALANFHSNVWTFTWREWLANNHGVQLRTESYRNPSYERHGVELSLFKDF